MAQYIPKDALVAGIENRIKELQNLYKENEEKSDSIQKTAILLCIEECKVILSLLDTLEVKEVDLEKEFENYMDKYNGVWVDSDYIRFAEHFFALGMSVSDKA